MIIKMADAQAYVRENTPIPMSMISIKAKKYVILIEFSKVIPKSTHLNSLLTEAL